ERAVGRQRLAVLDVDDGRRAGGLKLVGADENAAGLQLLRLTAVLGVDCVALVLGHVAPLGLVVVDQEQILHGVPPSGSLTSLGRTGGAGVDNKLRMAP